MKRQYSYRVDYSYLDKKDGRLNSFIDIFHITRPSEPRIKTNISQRWERNNYYGSDVESIRIENIEIAR